MRLFFVGAGKGSVMYSAWASSVSGSACPRPASSPSWPARLAPTSMPFLKDCLHWLEKMSKSAFFKADFCSAPNRRGCYCPRLGSLPARRLPGICGLCSLPGFVPLAAGSGGGCNCRFGGEPVGRNCHSGDCIFGCSYIFCP